ncbi:hypothetical protein [Roseovarius aestuarii]|uniref:Lipoprotein n=1 Tax=Roseovarius aestuarii TaxID=475083 RepID=A0A1X7BYE1_9RHOB|nr:hypothetical protein [Roseovarius aestuarii]SMC14289.1 hypothetical protein ROA7745_04155 [Roseovarius aestuarii]
MTSKIWIALGVLIASIGLSGCAPVVLAGAGAAAVVAVDKAAEEDGDDGIF